MVQPFTDRTINKSVSPSSVQYFSETTLTDTHVTMAVQIIASRIESQADVNG